MSAGSAAVTVTGTSPDVQISSVSVTPDDPGPGERVTVETTVSNLQSSDGTVEITDVYLRRSGSTAGSRTRGRSPRAGR